MPGSGQIQFSFEWAVVIAIAAVACATDVRSRRVPNVLTGPAWILGLAWSFSQGGWARLGDGFAASLMLALPYVLLFMFAGGGAGDAKLMAAIGAWLGILNGLLALFAVALCGALLAVGYALHHKRLRSVITYVKQSVGAVMYTVSSRGRMSDLTLAPREREEMMTMPYGVAIFLGACLAAGMAGLWSA
jgi:prepilin peptidase CpaA